MSTSHHNRYILYARKSEEDRARQVQSIADQVKELRHVAERDGLTVVCELREEQSAKAPGRPVFNAMLHRIQAGEADGILVWGISRLLRNPIDEGTVKWMLQKGTIRAIRTVDKEYSPEDNVLLLGVESGVATQYVLDLRKAVTRGMRSKVEKGWSPHRAPLGYVNNKHMEKGEKTISPDPELFPAIRRAWELLLTGAYTVERIRDVMNNDWGIRTPVRRGGGGMPVPRQTLHRLFGNVFYAGYFRAEGKLVHGAHTPMVTLDEFQRAQKLLNRGEQTRPQVNSFAFTGMVRCDGCGALLTASRVVKRTGRTYVYYHCQGGNKCRKIGLREEDILQRIRALLSSIAVQPEFYAWAVDEIERQEADTHEADRAVQHQHLRALQEADKHLDCLLDMRMRELITDEEYLAKKRVTIAQRDALHSELVTAEASADRARQSALNAAHFALNAEQWFERGDSDLRRTVARALAPRYTWSAGELHIELHPLLVPFQQQPARLGVEHGPIEPALAASGSTKRGPSSEVRTVWSSMWDDVRTQARRYQASFPLVGNPGDYELLA